MRYKILQGGEEINVIIANESFVHSYCEANGYTYEPDETPEPEPTEEEKLRADVDFLLAMGGYIG